MRSNERRSLMAIETIEIALVIATIVYSLYFLCRVDRQMWGLALYLMLPPVLAVALRLFGRDKHSTLYIVACVYLVCLAIGCEAAQQPSVLPVWDAAHPADTEFAHQWNKLPAVHRRVISFVGWLGAVFLFFLLGYGVFWIELARRRAGLPTQISTATCVSGLIVVWGIAIGALLVPVCVLFFKSDN